jgi:trans-2,3-dihydro-3-hydroxyanthranilate isomerase
MKTYAYRLLNVFAESTFGGNALCVFEDARGMSDAQMQSLALQFNLSETSFILPSETATARVRIFTPGFEMAFAGHPTLGTAQVVRAVAAAGDQITLEMKAGVVPVTAQGNTWTLTAPSQGGPQTSPTRMPPQQVAALFGLQEDDLLELPLWVDTGAHQLMVPLKHADAVRRSQPQGALLGDWEGSKTGRRCAYVFAFDGVAEAGRTQVQARYFFATPGGGVLEDPGTGSACANLGGWLLATGRALPASVRVEQGAQAGRPCTLWLDVAAAGGISVGGQVLELGRGTVSI